MMSLTRKNKKSHHNFLWKQNSFVEGIGNIKTREGGMKIWRRLQPRNQRNNPEGLQTDVLTRWKSQNSQITLRCHTIGPPVVKRELTEARGKAKPCWHHCKGFRRDLVSQSLRACLKTGCVCPLLAP